MDPNEVELALCDHGLYTSMTVMVGEILDPTSLDVVLFFRSNPSPSQYAVLTRVLHSALVHHTTDEVVALFQLAHFPVYQRLTLAFLFHSSDSTDLFLQRHHALKSNSENERNARVFSAFLFHSDVYWLFRS